MTRAGQHETVPLYIGCKGRVYDVSSSEDFYGPGGGYAHFTGKDASRALARMDIKEKASAGERWLCLYAVLCDVAVSSCCRSLVCHSMLRDLFSARALRHLCLRAVSQGESLEGLTRAELQTLDEWTQRFNEKYPVVGTLQSWVAAGRIDMAVDVEIGNGVHNDRAQDRATRGVTPVSESRARRMNLPTLGLGDAAANG